MKNKFKGIEHYIRRFNKSEDGGDFELSFITEMVEHIAELEQNPPYVDNNGVGFGIGEGAKSTDLMKFPEGFINALNQSKYRELPAFVVGKSYEEIRAKLAEFSNEVYRMEDDYNSQGHENDKGKFLYNEGSVLGIQYLIYGDRNEGE